jgi:hypothetical protein
MSRSAAAPDHDLGQSLDSVLLPRGQSSDALIHDVLDVAIEISGANKGMLQRYDEVNDCLRIVASRGFPGLRSEPF